MLQLEFGPGHQVWQHLERGVQIVVGVSAISLITFLGEVWGEESVPYDEIFIGLWWLGYGFLISLAPTPLCWALVPVLGWLKPREAVRGRMLQAWAVLSLIGPLAVSLWMFVYASEGVIYALAVSNGVDYSDVDIYRSSFGDDETRDDTGPGER